MKRIRACILTFAMLLFSLRLEAQQIVANALLARTDTSVYAVAWSRDGDYFATSWENSVILWNAASNTICAVWSGHKAPVISGTFSSDSQWFLSVSEDNSVIIRNIDEKVSAIKITGDGTFPIQDAVFMDNGYSVMMPVDGLNTTHCFRLVMTNQFIFKGIANSVSPVLALDVDKTVSKLLITSADGTVKLFDLAANREIQSFPRYTASGIGAVFSPDGRYFLSSADRTSLVISPVTGSGSFFIRDGDQPINAALFSPDGTKIAAATKNGLVKVYDIEEGKAEHSYSILVEKDDVVESLDYSPDGEFLIAGTRKGYIFRWSLSGKEFIPIRRSYQHKDLEALAEVYADQTVLRDARTDEEEIASETVPDSAIIVAIPQTGVEVGLTFNTLNSDYYYGAFGLTGIYRNYRFFPIYFGGGLEFTAGIANNNYPYKYYVRDNGTTYQVNNPWIYSAGAFGVFGLAYFDQKKSLLVFTESRIGGNLKILYNNEFRYYLVGNLHEGLQFDILMGVQWKLAHLAVGTEFDTNFDFMFKGNLGVVIKLGGD